MMKIGFLSTAPMQTYMDKPTWHNGDTRDVTEKQGKYLIKTFPDNFMPADDMKEKLKDDKSAAKQAAIDDSLAAPAGHPDAQAGEMGGVDTSGLSEEEAKLYESAVAKIDKGEDLSGDEQAVFDKVEAQSESDDG